jgi:hypothetical protein
MKRGISTMIEIMTRGKVLRIEESVLRPSIFIVTFVDGTQANINEETYNKLNNYGN